jgi:hypothetical protein
MLAGFDEKVQVMYAAVDWTEKAVDAQYSLLGLLALLEG